MQERSNNKAIASLVLGIVSCGGSMFGIYGGLVGLVCGIIAIIMGVKAKNEAPSGLATAGFVLGIVGTVLCGLIVVACSCLIGGLASLAN